MVLALALIVLPAAGADAGPHRALLIGNDAYADPADRLDNCVNDARAMRQWLLTEGYQDHEITLLADARKADMVRAFEDLVAQCRDRPHEQVFVFYSGHGTTVPDDNGDEGPDDATDECLLGVDPIRKVVHSVEERDREIERVVLRDDQFFQYLNDIAARAEQLIVVIDSCYSGGLRKEIAPNQKRSGKIKAVSWGTLRRRLGDVAAPEGDPAPRSGAKGPTSPSSPPSELRTPPPRHAVVFFSSSNQYQPSQTGEQLSRFTGAFLDGVARERLRAAGADGILTLESLQRYLQAALVEVPQTPLILPTGIAANAPLIPGLLPDPDQADLQGRLAAILEGLLMLSPQTQVRDWTLEARASVPGPLPVGTRFALKVRPREAGHLVVFTVSPSGNVTFLFPNRHAPRSAINGGEERSIPYPRGLLIQRPVGTETYYAYWLERDLDPFEDFPIGRYRDQLVVGRLDDLARRLEARGLRLGADDLRTALTRGLAIRPAGGPEGGRVPDPIPARWTRAVVTIQSVEP